MNIEEIIDHANNRLIDLHKKEQSIGQSIGQLTEQEETEMAELDKIVDDHIIDHIIMDFKKSWRHPNFSRKLSNLIDQTDIVIKELKEQNK